MENEILSAQILLHPVDPSTATADIDAELEKVEQALKSYTCTASMLDYSVAVISGIIAGFIDAFVVGETPLIQAGQAPVSEQLMEVVKKVLAKDALKDKAASPVMHRPVQKGIPAMIPELQKIASQANPLGMLASVLVQIGQGGMLNNKNNKIQMFPDGVSGDDGIILIVAAAILGILKWLSSISSDENNQDNSGIKFKSLLKLCELIRTAPAFSAVVNAAEKWQKQLPNEMKNATKGSDSDMGPKKAFLSFFMMLGNVPELKNTNLQKVVKTVQKGKQLGLNEIPIIRSLTRQAFPVLINEIVVRSFFFAARLAKELKANEDISSINWENVIPLGNRDIDRMMALSTMTLSVSDTVDAAIHAAIDSCGNSVLFATRFVTRFNYVAAGRAAVAVVKEISNEKAEAELIHRKRLLEEAKTAKALEILYDYQQQLELRVSEYLTEDITAFLEGLDCMDQGIAEQDSNRVIKGNVIIQRVLGKEPQFTNQQEFDDLMDSDVPLRL